MIGRDEVLGRRVLHFSQSILAGSETFVQQRLRGDRFRAVLAGWERVDGGLEVPCRWVILPQRTPGPARSFPGRVARRLVSPLKTAHGTLDIIKLLVRSAPAIVHAHFGTVGIAVAQACELLQIPLVTSFYGFDVGWLPRQRGGASVYRRLFDAAAALTVEGPALARALMRLGAPPEKVKLLPLAFPAELLGELERRPDTAANHFTLLQIARFVEKKGIDVTLRALALARREGTAVRLVLVGDGPLRPAVESLIAELDLKGAVELPGFLPHRDLGQLFERAHAYVQPSRTASNGDTEGGHPAVLLEAQARGVPVLSTTHADIPLVVRDGVTGLLCPENDHEALARNIIRLAKEPRTCVSMGIAARNMVLRRHHPSIVRELQERVYREALRRHAIKPRQLPFLPPRTPLRDPFDGPAS